jgi:FkbM family methyltransferase
MFWTALKRLIPNRSMSTRILSGPFRGAVICLNPRDNLRKIFGLYEHELNDWLSRVLQRVDIVLDVGANDGYFTFGCAAAFRRSQRTANVVAFEPQADHCRHLEASLRLQADNSVNIAIERTLVGGTIGSGVTTLDAVTRRDLGGQAPDDPSRTALIKIDVEGAELDVIKGASGWLRPNHYFLIEVHRKSYLTTLKRRFADVGIALEQRNQQPLPFLGRERRAEANWWLVSRLD